MVLQGLFNGTNGNNNEAKKFAGEVVLMKKSSLDHTDFTASLLDRAQELLGHHVTLQLVSSTVADSLGKGVVGKEAVLEQWATTLTSLAGGESKFKVHFEWDESLGIPGAVIVKNDHKYEFFLKTLTVEGLGRPGKETICFVCDSWVYPRYPYDRVFFTNDTYLPSTMPSPLLPYREQDLVHLRGDDIIRPLETQDRVYGYAVYNDLGDPDQDEDHARPVLGGARHPYPRRGRTGREPTSKDPNSESREKILNSLDVYVPRDERFSHLKLSDFFAYSLKSLGQSLFPALRSLFEKEFHSFEDTLKLYSSGIPLPHEFFDNLRSHFHFEFIKEWFRTDGAHAFRLPVPHVLKEDKFAWRSDEEFGREMLAGVNPVVIRRLEEFPPKSKLDEREYGNQTSIIIADHIEKNLDGLSVDQALNENRLFILDHHDNFMPYLPKLNALEGNYIYASRTLLFLKEDGTLKPVAIELSQVHPEGFEHGPISKVYTPALEGVESSIWQLAKAYAAVNDSGFHQLISHWLNTHAVIEPFIIATHRHLSVTHPIHKLMSPHYRDTMNINALARQTLINAGGIFERTVFPQKYALEMSSDVYKTWNLTEQRLPDDLIKRGIAVKDPSSPNELRLLIKDYPYAVDGLAVWSAIESWVTKYCSIYYTDDHTVQTDTELQAWWQEVREVGHGDLKDKPWWPNMNTFQELTKTCTTIIWVASALHAAVNFGQYPYCGYLPNRPTVSRRPMPEPGTKEYEELIQNPEKSFLTTITSQLQTLLGISLIEVLSRHSTDEIYLGQRDYDKIWTSDDQALKEFDRFSEVLIGIEREIEKRNGDEGLKNRNGPVKFPYTLLYPNTSDRSGTGGLVPKGIPNSVSI